MKTILIAAMAKENRVIGKSSALPWNLPEDLANFKAVTTGFPVIMGRKTFESLPPRFRPLPGRKNVVISSQPSGDQSLSKDALEWVGSPEEALFQLQKEGRERVFVIGGAQIYSQFLKKNLADEIWISLVPGEYDGDAFFPEFETQFTEFERTPFSTFEFVKFQKN